MGGEITINVIVKVFERTSVSAVLLLLHHSRYPAHVLPGCY